MVGVACVCVDLDLLARSCKKTRRAGGGWMSLLVRNSMYDGQLLHTVCRIRQSVSKPIFEGFDCLAVVNVTPEKGQ